MPIRLSANRPAARFYRGGERIALFRGAPRPAGREAEEREPEDWIASTTTVAGETRTGLTVLPDGVLLRDAVAADPVRWLGAAHAHRWGSDTRLLVKLLDAGQRLPVHAHPDDAFAWTHGQLVYADRPLDAVARDLARYGGGTVSVDPALRDIRVTGVIRIGDPATLDRQLEQLLPIRIERHNGQRAIVPARH